MSTVIFDSAHVGGEPSHLKISFEYDGDSVVSSHRSLCDFRSQEASMREAILPHYSTFLHISVPKIKWEKAARIV